MSGSRVHPLQVVYLLRATQNVLDTEGWIKGKLHSMGGNEPEGHCLVGALYKASRDENMFYQITDVTLSTLSRTLFHIVGEHSGIGQWNDQKTTSRAMVDTLIETAIKEVMHYASEEDF
jgi:hypothetical protein